MRNLLAIFCLVAAIAAHANDADLPDQVVSILTTHCAECHANGHDSGGFRYVTDLEKLVADKYIVPRDLKKSYLYDRAAVTQDMPPSPLPKLTRPEIDVLTRWVQGGALAPAHPPAPATLVEPLAILHQAVEDLEKLPSGERRWTRYLSLQHVYNLLLTRHTAPAEITARLTRYGKGLAKALNSLSLGDKVVDLQPVGTQGLLFRLNLRDYGWDHDTWEKVVNKNSFTVQSTDFDQRKANSYTGTFQPVVRGDWFVSAITVPPLYYDILSLPKTDLELERQLGVEVQADIADFTAQRAGVIQSGVSQNNRIVERHPLKSWVGSYWKSYDFVDNNDKHNILEFPLGPRGFDTNFEPAAGEIIWNLPNGLQAYFLIAADPKNSSVNKRIDTALTTIVSDPERPDKLVIDGLSCISCHAQGMKRYRGDVIRAHVQSTNALLFPVVARLYPPDDQMFPLIDQDAQRFQKGLAVLGIDSSDSAGTEPVLSVVQYFEAPLDLAALAFEVGVSPEALRAAIDKSDRLRQTIGYLETPNKTIKRETLQPIFQDLLNELSRTHGLGG